MLLKLLKGVTAQHKAERNVQLYREIIAREAEIGGRLFGPLKAGSHREFFCLNETTWIWHEEWIENGVAHIVTTRYDVRPDGIFKAQDHQPYRRLTATEEENFRKAVKLYNKEVDAELYGIGAAA